MKKITILLILLILLITNVSAWSLKDWFQKIYTKPKNDSVTTGYAVCADSTKQYNELLGKYNNLVKTNEVFAKELTSCQIEKINKDREWEKLLWRDNYYAFYPTGCKNPKKTFTMCKEGCDIKYFCDTNSMNPLFYCNAKLTLVSCTTYNLGDIILTKNQNKKLNEKYNYLIHSIVKIEGDKFITKGYNNQGVDDFKSSIFDVEGKVVKIEYA